MFPDVKVRKVAAACALSLGGLLAWSPMAQGATSRWNDPQFSPTADQGLYLGGLNLNNREVLRAASLPSFTFEGHRYTFSEDHRVGEPTVTEGAGLFQVAVPYAVPVAGGVVNATVSYTLVDQARVDTAASQLSSWVQFTGPRGDYAFRWRMDLDLGAASHNVVEVTEADEDTYRLTHEGVVELFDDTVFEVVDVLSYEQQSRVRVVAHEEDNPRVYVANFEPGETEGAMAVADGARLSDDGDDAVLWFETRLYNSAGGLTGPDLEAATAFRVNAIVEMDKMSSAPWMSDGEFVYGEFRSLASGFATASINVTNVQHSDANLADDSSSTNAELHSLMVSNKDLEGLDTSSNWYSWTVIANKSASGAGVLGIMFDDGATNTDNKPRQGCAGFHESHDGNWPEGDTKEAELILTMTHETGHVYNQHHEDFCVGKGFFDKSKFQSNSAIMGYAFMDTSNWTFGWNSINVMANGDVDYVRPGHGKSFTGNGGTPGYACWGDHCDNHASTSCRRFCCR